MDIKFDKLEAVVKMKHIDFIHIYAKRQFDPVAVLKWGEFGRVVIIGKLIHGLAAELKTHKTMFLRWEQITIAQNAFNVDSNITKRAELITLLNTPLTVRHWVSGVGNSSLLLQFQVTDGQNGKVLVNGMVQTVIIDLKTRKPTPLSTDIRNYVEENLTTKPELRNDLEVKQCQSRYEAPTSGKVFIHMMTIPYFAVDHNNHVNHAFYIKIWLDAIHHGFDQDAFKNIPNDLSDLEIQNMSFLFIGEVNIGDDIAVKVWQNDDNAFLFHIHAEVKKQLVHQSEVTFCIRDKTMNNKL